MKWRLWMGSLLAAHSALAGEVETVGRQLAEARVADSALPQPSEMMANLEERQAYAIQRGYVGELLNRGWRRAGIKGAVVGEAGQQKLGLKGPLSAVLFAEGWIDASTDPVSLPLGVPPGVELELGLILSSTVDVIMADVSMLKRRASALVPVVELPASRLDWTKPRTAADMIAINVGSDRFLVGDPCGDLDLDLDALKLSLEVDGKIVNKTSGGDARGGQWKNLLHQVNWAVRNGIPLQPGDVVITGALGKIHPGAAGRYRADFDVLGEIAFELVAE